MSACSCRKNIIDDYICPVVKLEKLSERIFWLTVRCAELARNALPGNALMVFPSDGLEPLLGRPFGVADADPESGEISVCFMLWGKGTELISHFREGDLVHVRGLFAVPFPEREGKVYFACGGAGAALFLYLCKKHPERVAGLYLGIPGKGYEKYAERVLELVPEARVFTDDGSFGEGDSMFTVLPKEPGTNEEVWACGPPGFLAALERHYENSPEKLFFALDRHMACGYGGCMGCAVETKSGLKRLCVDQSLFRSDEVVKDEH